MTSLIKTARIVVFGAQYCGFCKRAKTMLTNTKANFNYCDIENEEAADQLLALQEEHNYRKIPMIFVDGYFIGGYQELAAAVKSKKIILDEMQ